MPREIRKKTETESGDDYLKKILKQIPSEIIGLYLALNPLIPESEDIAKLVIIAVLTVLTPIYLLKVQKVTNTTQIIISSISFVVWVLAIGGFDGLQWIVDNEWIKSIVLILWSTVASWFL